MIFRLASSNRLEVILSAQDAAQANISFESESPADLKRLKKYLLSVLAQAQTHTEAPFFTGQRLLIEIHPDDTGGAAVYFIGEGENARQLYEPMVFCFDCSDDMLEAALKLFKLYGHRLFKSSLYQLGECWQLIIGLIDGDSNSEANLLTEYGGTLIGRELMAALIKEHGRPIIRERAVDMLCYYFG